MSLSSRKRVLVCAMVIVCGACAISALLRPRPKNTTVRLERVGRPLRDSGDVTFTIVNGTDRPVRLCMYYVYRKLGTNWVQGYSSIIKDNPLLDPQNNKITVTPQPNWGRWKVELVYTTYMDSLDGLKTRARLGWQSKALLKPETWRGENWGAAIRVLSEEITTH